MFLGRTRKKIRFASVFSSLFFLAVPGLGATWITGYYSAQNGVLPAAAIPWEYYSHIVHFAAAPGLDSNRNGNGTIALNYLTQAEIDQLVASRPPGKKLLVCVKDNDHNLKAFAQATTPSRLPDFVRNITSFVSRNGYDGVDIDWEANVDVAQYANLLSRLRTAMPQKIITLAVGDWQDLDRVAAESQPRVDQINVMCYDMDNGQNCHGLNCSWHDAALFQAGERDKRTCDHRVNAFTRAGVSPGKIGIGLPFFGRLRSGTDQPEVFGSFPSNTVYFRDLTTDSSRWQKSYTHFDQKFGAEYLSIPKRNEFVSYVGAESIKEAVRWQQKENFGGLMTFALEYEYLQKQSGNARYPLSSVLYGQVVKANSESAKENVQRPKVPSR